MLTVLFGASPVNVSASRVSVHLNSTVRVDRGNPASRAIRLHNGAQWLSRWVVASARIIVGPTDI